MMHQGHAAVSGRCAQVEAIVLTPCCSKHDSLWLDRARLLLLQQSRCSWHVMIDKLSDLHATGIFMPSKSLQAAQYASTKQELLQAAGTCCGQVTGNIRPSSRGVLAASVCLPASTYRVSKGSVSAGVVGKAADT